MGRASGQNSTVSVERRTPAQLPVRYVEIQAAPPEDHEGYPSCGEMSDEYGCGATSLTMLHTVILWENGGGETLVECLCERCARDLAEEVSSEHGALPVRLTRFGRSRA